ncbi:MAG: hypothetical protein GC155_10065 [Alphaproteobacteria bacterium]|nr:hypothetical protein [Alphaproteobacteria bacterium]
MFRKYLIIAAALAASACSYGSAVDVAPMADRIAQPVIPAGDYCAAKGAQGAYEIHSEDDCAPIIWHAEARSYTMVDTDTPSDSVTAAIVALGGGVYAAQYETPDSKGMHEINMVIASGKAFAALAPLGDAELDAVVKRHRKLVFGRDGKRATVASGKVEDVKAYLRDAAGEALKLQRAKGEELSVGVLDKQGTPDHPASPSQVKDIESVKALAEKFTPR